MIDESYREFAETPRQHEVLDAVIKHGSNTKAAKALNCHRRTVDKCMARIKDRYDEHHGIVAPDGFFTKKTSTLKHLANGDLRWEIVERDAAEQAELMRAVVEAMKDDIPKSEPELALQIPVDDDKLNAFVITDYHLGMKAWPEEVGGEGWDLDIAEDLLVKWFAEAIRTAPQAGTAVFAQLGDFLHWDDANAPITPLHGNVLDGDSRTQKVVRIAIKVLRRCTRMLLQSHEHVHLVMAEGNHDPASSIWLRELFHAMYEDEPRITVDLSPDPYYCYEHGLTSLFFHHGHKRKPINIDSVFVAKFREVFGRTKYSYGHMGHLHNKQVVESNLMTITQHRTLASPDAYASRGGWMSGRSASRYTYSKVNGFLGEACITPEMVA